MWLPTFYPIYEEPSFPLPNLPVEAVLCLCEGMLPRKQVKFLTSTQAIARQTDIQVNMFQQKRHHKLLFAVMGEWAYYIKWILPREIACSIPDHEECIGRAFRHWVKFNRNTCAECMTINNIAWVWGIYGTELCEEIDRQEDNSDFGDDDIMQQ